MRNGEVVGGGEVGDAGGNKYLHVSCVYIDMWFAAVVLDTRPRRCPLW